MVQAVTPKSEERIPPQNIEAEQSVLGSLMLDKEAVMKVVDFLTVKDFYKGTHQAVYKTMINLFERREPIDILSVTTKLRETKSLEEAGGQAYLAELVNSVPTASNIAHYAKIVQKKRILRELIGASYDIAQLGYKEEEDIDVLLDEAERRIFGISETSLTQNFVQVKSSLEEAFERIDKLHRQEGGTRGVPTGFADLDNYLAGLQKSDLIVLAARPGLGKTSSLLISQEMLPSAQKYPWDYSAWRCLKSSLLTVSSLLKPMWTCGGFVRAIYQARARITTFCASKMLLGLFRRLLFL